MQSEIANIWQRILSLDAVGLKDNFFGLGGHSLLATKLITAINREFRIKLPLYSIFEADTLEQFSALVEKNIKISSAIDHAGKAELSPHELSSYPLADKYKGMLYLHQRAANKGLYNVSVALKLSGQLESKRLQYACQKLASMHDSLRTHFYHSEKDFYAKTIDLLEVDVQEINPGQALSAKQINQLLVKLTHEPIDIQQAPLWRVYQINLAADQTILLFVAHHIITDEWSLGILVEHLAAYYNSDTVTTKSECSSFASYNQSLLQYQASDKMLQDKQYWQHQLANTEATTLLKLQDMTDRQQRGQLNCWIDKQTQRDLHNFCSNNNTTIFTCLLTVFNCLLSRYLQQHDICIGSIISNRTDDRFAKTMGFLVDNIVLRTQFDEDENFKTALGKVEQTLIEAYTHSGLSYSSVVAQYREQTKGHAGEPINILFVMNHPYDKPQFDTMDIEIVEPVNASGEYELVFAVREMPGKGIELKIDYDKAYTDNFVTDFLANYISFIDTCMTEMQTKLAKLNILAVEQYQSLIAKDHFKFTKCSQTIDDVFTRICQQYPTKEAICYQGKITQYHELQQHSNSIAKYIAQQFITFGKSTSADTIVAVIMSASDSYIKTILAITKLGLAFLPIDNSLPDERIKYILDNSNAAMVIAERDDIATLTQQGHLFIKDTEIINSAIISKETIELQSFAKPSKPESLAYLIYTSGTTGTPKGVMLEQHALVNFAMAISDRIALQPNDKVLQFANLGFDASIWEIFTCLLTGASLYMPTQNERLVGKPLQKFIANHELTAAILPPSLLNHLEVQALPSLQKLTVGGDKCPLAIAKRWASGRTMFNAYGPTETTICATIANISPHDEWMTIGKPIANMVVILLDEQLQPVPVGCVGEIFIAGVGVGRGYTDTKLTDKSFVTITLSGQAIRCYKSGDLARYSYDGNLIYLGRKDRQVKINGLRIELSEIENCFIAVSCASQAHVLVTDDGTIRIFYLAANKLDHAALIAKLRRKLPSYMVPHDLIYLDEFPMTVNGKIADKQLAKIQPEMQQIFAPEGAVTSLSATEKQILMSWQAALQHDNVTIADDFFSLGGNSLQIMQIIAELNDMFNTELTMRDFFDNPTIAQLAKHIDYSQSAISETVV